jgi:hypothetical protein
METPAAAPVSEPQVIKPSVGRVVLYRPTEQEREIYAAYDNVQPFRADVLYVHGDRCINLMITSHSGKQFAKTSVFLEQPGDAHPNTDGGYAHWMEYQIRTNRQ